MSRSKTGIPGLSFSWRRASGLSQVESEISRKTGIPLTRSGRQRKMGRIFGHLIGWMFAGLVVFVGYQLVVHPELMKMLTDLAGKH